MTEKKISRSLGRIAQCKRNKYPLEALLSAYHLNIDLVRFIIVRTSPSYTLEGKKVKAIIKEFQHEASVNSELKSIINKQSIKSLKLWLDKMDVYFKSLKLEQPRNTLLLLNEAEKICAILMISTKKLFVKKIV